MLLNLMFSIRSANPSSKSFSSGMLGGGFVELKPYVFLLGLSRSGFRKKKVLHRRFFTNVSVLLIKALIYCFWLHIGMFLVEQPKRIGSDGDIYDFMVRHT